MPSYFTARSLSLSLHCQAPLVYLPGIYGHSDLISRLISRLNTARCQLLSSWSLRSNQKPQSNETTRSLITYKSIRPFVQARAPTTGERMVTRNEVSRVHRA